MQIQIIQGVYKPLIYEISRTANWKIAIDNKEFDNSFHYCPIKIQGQKIGANDRYADDADKQMTADLIFRSEKLQINSSKLLQD